jgi:hypothetical protein
MCSYNATIFQSLSAFEYYVYSVNEAFVAYPDRNLTLIGPFPDLYADDGLDQDVIVNLRKMYRDGRLERLQRSQCIDAYSKTYQTSRGDVLLVTSNTTRDLNYRTQEPVIHYEITEMAVTDRNLIPYSWVCGLAVFGTFDRYPCQPILPAIRANSTWEPFGREIEYCLSQPVAERCEILYSIYMGAIVVASGVIKTVVMLYTAFVIQGQPLLTIGDAVCSFIKNPEVNTENMCLCIATNFNAKGSTLQESSVWSSSPLPFSSKLRRRLYVAGRSRWIVVILV